MLEQGANSVAKQYHPQEMTSYFEHTPDFVVSKLRQLVAVAHMCTYEIAVRLYRVWDENLWERPEYCTQKDSYPTFGEWVYNELGFSARKGRYLVGIARRVNELQVPPATVKELMDKGWSRAYHLLRAQDHEQLLEWHEACEGCSERETIMYVKHKMSIDEDVEGTPAEDALTRPVSVKVKFLRQSQYGFYREAMAQIERRHGVKSTPEALSLMAANYLATTFPGGEEAIPAELDHRLRVLEEQYGVQLAVVTTAEETSG